MNRDTSVAGRRVRLVHTNDQYTDLEPGAEGTARYVTADGILAADWDSGSTLMLIDEAGDRWEWLS